MTISSIEGDYLYVVVQVTQDTQPVAYPHWKLPGDKFDLHVPNLTLSQFNNLAVELGRKVDTRKQKATTTAQWYSLLRGSMLSLAELLSVRIWLFDGDSIANGTALDCPTQYRPVH